MKTKFRYQPQRIQTCLGAVSGMPYQYLNPYVLSQNLRSVCEKSSPFYQFDLTNYLRKDLVSVLSGFDLGREEIWWVILMGKFGED